MSFRKNQLTVLKQEVETSTYKNKLDDIKDTNQENRIQILENLLTNIVSLNNQYTNDINNLKSRLDILENRYNRTFPQTN